MNQGFRDRNLKGVLFVSAKRKTQSSTVIRLCSISDAWQLAAMAGFDGPLLSIAGSGDTVVVPQPEVAQRFLDAHENGPEKLVVLETDHTFNSFVEPDGVAEAISVTLDWLRQHLQ